VLDEDGFGNHSTGAAGTGEPGDCRQQMQKQDGQIAHRTILARSRHAQEMLTHFGIRHAHLSVPKHIATRTKPLARRPTGSRVMRETWSILCLDDAHPRAMRAT
jgi:hypothetical protein